MVQASRATNTAAQSNVLAVLMVLSFTQKRKFTAFQGKMPI
jgi:hypothetical protein